ncbi:MAG TPA: cyclic beta 1-2 glucan synthetase, partial [Casimicrobiaceae bacterium]|nr:cyclic beta 1-2 glucan synthetase [Casimicrobiaceae bacterium]
MSSVRLLSNGTYHVMVTAAGSGYSRCRGLAVTRWREDSALDPWGTFCYLRDSVDGTVWSTTMHPTSRRPDACETGFDSGAATFSRRDYGLETRSEIAVSPVDPVELRRVRLTNLSGRRRSLSATSYAEVVLAAAGTDSAHPAFSKLFVETGIDPALRAIFATRRPSAPGDPTPWLFHLARVCDSEATGVSYETDRMRFIGRGRSTADPAALCGDTALSGSAGPVLDAVAAIRAAFTIEAGASFTIDWITGITESRDACTALARNYQDAEPAQRILERAGMYRQGTLQRLRASDSDALLYERMAASIIHAGAALRSDARVIEKNRRGQSGLWGFGISGDLPIVLLRVTDPVPIDLVRQMLSAHAYWRAFGIETDLVIIGATPDDRASTAFQRIKQLLGSGSDAEVLDRPGGTFVLDDARLDDGDRILLQTVARVSIDDSGGTLVEQLDRAGSAAGTASAARATGAIAVSSPGAVDPAIRTDRGAGAANSAQGNDLLAFNGLGGFTPDAREYVIAMSAAQMTPAPWVNVLANPEFGTLVSESGSATTWSENAHEFRLTPWSNDPVGDPNTEAFYIRDEATGRYWSPTLLPTCGVTPYVARHGFGYSVFEHTESDIESELCIHVAIDAPIKFSALTLRNRSDRSRRLSVTGYLDWVLGDERPKTLMHVVTELDAETGALFARNSYNTDFAGRTAFFDVDDATRQACGDRSDFFGPDGILGAPAGLAQAQLSGRVGAALDPCAALRVTVELAPGEEREIVFRLGAGKAAAEARELVRRWRGVGAAHAALEAVRDFWRTTLGAVQVRTPDPTL